MMNPLRNYIENCIDAFIVNILEPVTTDYATRIESLEREIKILKCNEHIWVYRSFVSRPGFGGTDVYVGCVPLKCSKCGKTHLMSDDDWDAYKLDKALDEVERLGGEVER